MIQNYEIITLCGSTLFKEQYVDIQKKLTLEGYIVISIGGYIGESTKQELAYAIKTRKKVNYMAS